MASFGANARKDAVTHFDWERAIMPKYLRIYEELTGKHA